MKKACRALKLLVYLAPLLVLVGLIKHHAETRDFESFMGFDVPYAGGVVSWLYLVGHWFGDAPG